MCSSSNSTSSSSQLLILLYCVAVFVVVVFHIPVANGLLKLPPNETIPAVIVFGDSIMDTGNNNNLKTLVKCNFPPYGQDFKGQKPTGRFGNGMVPSDFIVQELGIKEFLPAYSDPNLHPQDLITGVCFASGGTGYDPMTPKIASVISLSDQIQMFKEYIGKLQGMVGEERTNFILANSLFLVVAGSDDIANTYFTVPLRKLQYDVPAYTDLMVNSASGFLQELYGLGARRIGVFSAPPIGCVPSQRTLGGGMLRECAKDYNGAARLFNSKLSATMDSLTTQLPNSKLVYIDVYNPLLDLIINHQNYGFENSNKGCCGTGTLEVVAVVLERPTWSNMLPLFMNMLIFNNAWGMGRGIVLISCNGPLVLLYEYSTSSRAAENETIPAVFTFGDSILDTGNNNNVKTFTKCIFPPYGRDFVGGEATGRFSNGKVPSDLIAEALGLREIIPAYLDLNLKDEDLPTGVSFASGGSGNDPLTASILACNNDIAITYSSTGRRLEYNFPSHELYEVGARRIGFLSTLPLGCLPSQSIAGGLLRECAVFSNQEALYFNAKLSSQLDYLKTQVADAKLVFVDVYNPLLHLIQNPHDSGFEVVGSGCCGTGLVEIGATCNPFSNAATYVFWDSDLIIIAAAAEDNYYYVANGAAVMAFGDSFLDMGNSNNLQEH
ncbi:hypothetical protein FNV43_RR11988 [Rhamnella rubrinervis]|uniref:Uncharacterized protein n=1 Tax=Rhamnella rubrinervis TaxID=2594499 RepID=A0A8K0H732_9ROSA|nr:hypothetical protein FNV43_RR11988 [Rhamnella rubrinervis]